MNWPTASIKPYGQQRCYIAEPTAIKSLVVKKVTATSRIGIKKNKLKYYLTFYAK
jgi:hypothetical protein